ncbi:hypothetical protein LTR37_008589 [Vermiconidia calcicola]|uniref:Uncharacterized protein n=1 Tax=Vermiconidia calcicola TaxID=1690605 RepID=A0ACC3NBS1_9PEZI|nr:hypothetical protein LTR37_008589 [Vermiconidia calcicola]
MAQRAYRQRKETKLDGLRRRVSELTSTIESMNDIFTQCRDRLNSSNLNQVQVLDLEKVSVQFEDLVKDARHSSDDVEAGEAATAMHGTSTSSGTNESGCEKTMQPKNVPSWLDQSVLSSINDPKSSSTNCPLGYSMLLPENETSLQSTECMATGNVGSAVASTETHQQTVPIAASDISYADIQEAFPLTPQPRLPMTYSFQETTLARRLHRSCAELAYQLVLDPNRKPAEYERIFRLTLLGRNREKLTACLKTVLERGPHEELDFWEAPLIHVGGAGTHYSRRDPFGNLLSKKTSHNLGIIGPQTLSLLENAAKSNISTDMTVEIAGFEGEWFDPYDVQGYLEEKGIFIDPGSSFAEAEIIEWSGVASPVRSLQKTSGSVRGRSTSPLIMGQENAVMNGADVDYSQWDNFTAVGYSDVQNGSWMNFIQPGQSINQATHLTSPWEGYDINAASSVALANGHLTPPIPPQRRNILIDVSKFVQVLVYTAVCLGRSPGFRRRDVDRALALSSFDALDAC